MGHLHEDLRQVVECGLPGALEVIGDKWSFMILRAGFNGVRHFDVFQSELGIARNILSNRLHKLVDNGIFRREPCEHDRRMVDYRLTDKAIDLLPTLVALRQWGEKYTTNVPSSPVLVDARDRMPIARVQLHAHDGRPLEYQDLDWEEADKVGKPAEAGKDCC